MRSNWTRWNIDDSVGGRVLRQSCRADCVLELGFGPRRPRGRRRARRERIGARRRRAALTSAARIVPANGNLDVAPDTPVVINTAAWANRETCASLPPPAPPSRGCSHRRARAGSRPSRSTTARRTTCAPRSRTPPTAQAELTSTFRTLAPATTVTASVFPSEGLQVGVGQPIVFRFDHYISDAAARAAVLQHLNVTRVEPVLGGWHWFSNNELHFRPAVVLADRRQDHRHLGPARMGRRRRDVGDGDGRVRFVVGMHAFRTPTSRRTR